MVKPKAQRGFLWWLFNDDEPRCPADLWPEHYGLIREMLWLLRNPFHNLFFYGIGWADKKVYVVGDYPSDVFAPDGGLKTHRVYLADDMSRYRPFVSYISPSFKFYIGWRERGNFGIKLTRNRSIIK